MQLTVNRVTQEVASPPLSSLLQVLREELGITSPKAGCQQGGFCTSGFVMAATALVDGGGGATREETIEALAGHVCRCTGYTKIVAAVTAAARGEVSPEEVEADRSPEGEATVLPGSPA